MFLMSLKTHCIWITVGLGGNEMAGSSLVKKTGATENFESAIKNLKVVLPWRVDSEILRHFLLLPFFLKFLFLRS